MASREDSRASAGTDLFAGSETSASPLAARRCPPGPCACSDRSIVDTWTEVPPEPWSDSDASILRRPTYPLHEENRGWLSDDLAIRDADPQKPVACSGAPD